MMEKRTFITSNAEFRAEEKNQEKYLEGYFIRFNQETNLYGNVYEQISPDSIPDDIGSQDIRALFNHDTAKVLGRTTSGTLELRKDALGIYGKVKINEQDTEALNIYSRVMRGDISSASFGFFLNAQDIEEREDETVHITIRDIELFEVSVVTFPAYPQTEIGARKRSIEQFSLENKKQKLKKELFEKWQIQS